MLHNLLNVLMLLLIQKKKLGGGGWFSLLFNSIFKITKINCLLCKTFKFFQNKKFSISCTYISLRERTAVFMLQSFLYTAKQWQLIQQTNLYNSNTIAFSLLTVPNSLYLPFTIFIYNFYIIIFIVREFFSWKFTRNYAFLRWEQSGTH